MTAPRVPCQHCEKMIVQLPVSKIWVDDDGMTYCMKAGALTLNEDVDRRIRWMPSPSPLLHRPMPAVTTPTRGTDDRDTAQGEVPEKAQGEEN